MSHATKIPFRGEADEAPNTVSGDVIVVLQQKEHPVFKRDGPNLFMKKAITLQEALCGFKFTITHLDGRVLLVKSDDATVYTPGSYKAVKDEGMPQVKNPYQRGSLYIEFDVEFPQAAQLTAPVRQELKRVLPSPAAQPMDVAAEGKELEEVHLADIDIEEERKKFQEQHREAYEEDEERRGPQAGCRAQ